MLLNTLFVLASISSALAHGTITGVTGANGVKAAGFGIFVFCFILPHFFLTCHLVRNHCFHPSRWIEKNPFQQDTSIIRDKEIQSGRAGVCGRTPAGGNNDVATQLEASVEAGLPTTSADGSLSMTLHQVNGDGAGPFTCEVSGDGGNTFQAAAVTTQVPGTNGRSKARAQDFPLVAQAPVGMTCTAGPNGDACIMRCRNPARAGPFGSCVAFSMGGNAAASGNATTAAPPAAAANGSENAEAGDAEAAGVDNAPLGTAAVGGAAAGSVAAGGAVAGGVAAGSNNAGGLSEILGGKLGGKKAKRYFDSRIAGKRSGYWLDNQ
ncbi:hypothetical protein C8J57DRAFT_1384712 [Mycena rebaudengoi]|nr:hypothetical protein C8J57DRAFT_1384712 [Mycena rebaudengoi]